jgi:hypothetical protein
MKVGSSNRTMERSHLPWSDSMVHGVDQPLELVSPSTLLGPDQPEFRLCKMKLYFVAVSKK